MRLLRRNDAHLEKLSNSTDLPREAQEAIKTFCQVRDQELCLYITKRDCTKKAATTIMARTIDAIFNHSCTMGLSVEDIEIEFGTNIAQITDEIQPVADAQSSSQELTRAENSLEKKVLILWQILGDDPRNQVSSQLSESLLNAIRTENFEGLQQSDIVGCELVLKQALNFKLTRVPGKYQPFTNADVLLTEFKILLGFLNSSLSSNTPNTPSSE